jgi:dolichol-phosphate mannosyltransferase
MTRPEGQSDMISVVVPCYNEQEVLEATHARLTQVLAAIPGARYEIVYVDDGSRDRTPLLLSQIRQADGEHVRVISFSRNFGHQVAVTAGLEHAAGDAVVLIDADLQDPPEIIPRLLAEWHNGADVAYGLRTARAGETPFKRFTASLFYRLINQLSDTPLPTDAGDFRLMDRQVVDALKQMPEHDRYLRGMIAWVGFNQVPVPYERQARAAGQTHYPLRKMMRFALDGLLSFSVVPLRLATALGFLSAALSLVGIVYALNVRLLTGKRTAGWATLFIAILFLGGIQLITIGIIGEYIGRIYREVKRRPLYLVKKPKP